MDDKLLSKIWSWFASLNQGQAYGFAGILVCVASFLGENRFSFDPERINYAYGFGVGLWLVGTILHVWRVRVEASRPIIIEPEIVPSLHDLEFLRLIDRPMTEAEIFAIGFPIDAAKPEATIRGQLNLARANKLAWAKLITCSGGIYRPAAATYFEPTTE